jgi:hypothetical protein
MYKVQLGPVDEAVLEQIAVTKFHGQIVTRSS